MRPRLAVAVICAAALAAATLGACAKNTGSGKINNSDLKNTQKGVIATDPKDSLGPAKPVEGAKRGGTLRIIRESDYEHLDPQRNYTLPATAFGELIYRGLTMFRQDGPGRMTLVGDLAETPGTDVNKDCKTWEFKLKKGLKFEDGREIKAADVNYGIARSFEENISDGAVYIQSWLADSGSYNDVYKGPYTSGTDKVPGLDVVDDYTLRFNFKQPHCDMPFAASMPTTVPVPKDKDTKENYDQHPFSSGPYKIKEYAKDSHLILERNSNWDPKSDAVRHDYPDQVYIELGPNKTQENERVLASNGDDAYAVAEDGVPQELVPQALDAKVKDRLINTPTGLVWRLEINNDRIKDIKVRQAIAYALDKQGILNAWGGDAAGELTHTVLPPSTLGYGSGYANPYDGGPSGNAEKAKALLGGQKIKLVMLSRQVDDPFLKAANVAKASLEKAGFEVVITTVVRNLHNPTTKTRGNQYDIWFSAWQPDWPSAASTIPVLYDGRALGPMGSKGNDNQAYFNEAAINSEISRINGLDATKAAPEWIKLDEKIFKEYCPDVPIFVSRTFALNGSKVGGVFNYDAIGQQAYFNAFLK